MHMVFVLQSRFRDYQTNVPKIFLFTFLGIGHFTQQNKSKNISSSQNQRFKAKERYKSVTDPLILPHRSRLSSAELPVLGGPQRSLLIDGANPYHFRSIQCFDSRACV
jgi:hypothetical protein